MAVRASQTLRTSILEEDSTAVFEKSTEDFVWVDADDG